MTRDQYPLQWPEGWPRTAEILRRRSSFGNGRPMSAFQTAIEVMDEMDRLGAANAVITSFLPTRSDGLPYSAGRCEDPGIAVWFVLDGHERVFACDQWETPAENMRAIAKSVQFAGFAALPPGQHRSRRPGGGARCSACKACP